MVDSSSSPPPFLGSSYKGKDDETLQNKSNINPLDHDWNSQQQQQQQQHSTTNPLNNHTSTTLQMSSQQNSSTKPSLLMISNNDSFPSSSSTPFHSTDLNSNSNSNNNNNNLQKPSTKNPISNTNLNISSGSYNSSHENHVETNHNNNNNNNNFMTSSSSNSGISTGNSLTPLVPLPLPQSHNPPLSSSPSSSSTTSSSTRPLRSSSSYSTLSFPHIVRPVPVFVADQALMSKKTSIASYKTNPQDMNNNNNNKNKTINNNNGSSGSGSNSNSSNFSAFLKQKHNLENSNTNTSNDNRILEEEEEEESEEEEERERELKHEEEEHLRLQQQHQQQNSQPNRDQINEGYYPGRLLSASSLNNSLTSISPLHSIHSYQNINTGPSLYSSNGNPYEHNGTLHNNNNNNVESLRGGKNNNSNNIPVSASGGGLGIAPARGAGISGNRNDLISTASAIASASASTSASGSTQIPIKNPTSISALSTATTARTKNINTDTNTNINTNTNTNNNPSSHPSSQSQEKDNCCNLEKSILEKTIFEEKQMHASGASRWTTFVNATMPLEVPYGEERTVRIDLDELNDQIDLEGEWLGGRDDSRSKTSISGMSVLKSLLCCFMNYDGNGGADRSRSYLNNLDNDYNNNSNGYHDNVGNHIGTTSSSGSSSGNNYGDGRGGIHNNNNNNVSGYEKMMMGTTGSTMAGGASYLHPDGTTRPRMGMTPGGPMGTGGYDDSYRNKEAGGNHNHNDNHHHHHLYNTTYGRNVRHYVEKKKKKWQPKIIYIMLNNPLIPLTLRLFNFMLSAIGLGLACSIFVKSHSNTVSQQPSTIMAIVVQSCALVYLIFISYDEYSGKPLGLRDFKEKVRLIMLDLLFIIFSSANLSLAFNTLFDVTWLCRNDPLLDYIMGTPDAAVGVTATGAMALASSTVSVSSFLSSPTSPFIGSSGSAMAATTTGTGTTGTTSGSNRDITPYDAPVCRRQRALVSFLLVILVSWIITFTISMFRLMERISSS